MNKATLKKIGAISLAALTTFSLAACGGGGGGSRDGKVKLEFVHYWPEHATLLKEICQHELYNI